MNTTQLLHCIRKDDMLSKYTSGVYPSDHLPRNEKFPFSLIANIDPATEPGRHWVALYVRTDKVGEFFDSYGRAPSENFASYLRKYCNNIEYNTVRMQGSLSSSCGQYCLYYLAQRVRGRSMKKIVDDFCLDFMLNDIYVAKYVERNFTVESSAYDFVTYCHQCCKPE